uniref:Innexin n=1 Tax=Parastrongyloides trichosuri TaxID=131310 RepID=A0A0N5A1F7_PARTI
MIQIPLIQKILDVFKAVKLDDLCDRVNYLYTGTVLVTLAIFLGSKQTFGTPLTCFIEAQYGSNWVSTVQSYCFISGTYTLKNESIFEMDLSFAEEEDKIYHNYYQWAPYILLLMAFGFYIPHAIWKMYNEDLDVDFKTLLTIACEAKKDYGEGKRKKLNTVINHLKKHLNSTPNINNEGKKLLAFGKNTLYIYFIIKFIYLINLICQIIFLNNFIGQGNSAWAISIFSTLFKKNPFQYQQYFPKITFCDYKRIDVGTVMSNHVECTLMVNILNEKIFMFAWFWNVILLFITFGNITYFSLYTFIPPLRRGVIMNTLKPIRFYSSIRGIEKNNPELFDELDNEEDQFPEDLNITCKQLVISRKDEVITNVLSNIDMFDQFVDQGLSLDGVLFVRFLSLHAGSFVTCEILYGLWLSYIYGDTLKKKKREYMDQSNSVLLSESQMP